MRNVWFARLLLVAIGFAAIAAAAGMLAIRSRSIPHLETARINTKISQFRMGPIGLPVSQTVRSDAFTLTMIELPLTSLSEVPVRIAVRVWSESSSKLLREALVEVPPGIERCVDACRLRSAGSRFRRNSRISALLARGGNR